MTISTYTCYWLLLSIHRWLMVKTLFYTGARVGEFVNIKAADLHPQLRADLVLRLNVKL